MRQIPSTLVLAALCLIAAAWPGVQTWAEATPVHHFLSHGLYLAAGGLFGLQTARWIHQPAALRRTDEAGVSS
ncbi:MAG: hypothetical protein IRZ33_08110 [Alicyclobacillaceae bacterium]|nr:hypothetical protein [Alicyclobacillaceae bacterium]